MLAAVLAFLIILLVLFLVFKCRIFGHVWMHYVYGKLCIWCNEKEMRNE